MGHGCAPTWKTCAHARGWFGAEAKGRACHKVQAKDHAESKPEDLFHTLRHCKVRKCEDQKKRKFLVMMTDVTLDTAFVAAMISAGADLKHGAPPQGYLERRASEILSVQGVSVCL